MDAADRSGKLSSFQVKKITAKCAKAFRQGRKENLCCVGTNFFAFFAFFALLGVLCG